MTVKSINIQPRPDVKAEVLQLFDRLDIIQPGDTGNITIHINCGGITKVTKQVEIK